MKHTNELTKPTPTQGKTSKICRYTITCSICILFAVTWTGIIGENHPKTTCCPVLPENRHSMDVQPLCRAWGSGRDLRSADLAYVFPEVGRRPEHSLPVEEHVLVHILLDLVHVSAG